MTMPKKTAKASASIWPMNIIASGPRIGIWRRIRYGNRLPLLFDPAKPDLRKPHVEQHDFNAAQWMFSLVFDYGEGRYKEEEPDGDGRIFTPAYDAQRPWSVRRDPFSSFRSCFEMRTYRLCRRA